MRCVLKNADQGSQCYLKAVRFLPSDKAEIDYTDDLQDAMTFTVCLENGEVVMKPMLPSICKQTAWEVVPVRVVAYRFSKA